jgi:hypothetical protein
MQFKMFYQKILFDQSVDVGPKDNWKVEIVFESSEIFLFFLVEIKMYIKSCVQ